MLAKDGSVAVYNVADKFTVNSDANKFSVGSDAGYTKISATQPRELQNIVSDGSYKADADEKLVTYRLDGNGNIKELVFVASTPITDKEYNADAQTIDRNLLADDAVLFNVDTSSMDNVSVVAVSSLVDESKYTGYIAKSDVKEDEYDCFVITKGDAAIDYTQDLAIVSAKSTVLVDDANAMKLSYYTANDETVKEITVTEETQLHGSLWTDYDKGTVFMFTEGADGVATDITVIAKISSGMYALQAGSTDAVVRDDDNEFVIGYIKDMSSRNGGKAIEYVGTLREKDAYSDAQKDTLVTASSAETIVVKSGANGYTVVNNSDTGRAYIAVADWQADEVYKQEFDVDSAGNPTAVSKRTYFIARLYNGAVKDIITLGDRVHN